MGAFAADTTDLHVHSTVSDGTVAPGALLHEAAAAGLTTIALTDHDSTAGWAEAAAEVEASGVTLIPGMELSARVEYTSVHLLAYLIDPAHPGLAAETERIRESRHGRAAEIVRRIERDYPLTWDDVLLHVAEGATIGRPHIADALVARGLAADRGAAFEGILHPSSGYVYGHYAPTPPDAVRLIREAGGVPVLAHPGTRGIDRVIPEDRLRRLVDAGLFGLEINHPENLDETKPRLHVLAAKYGLRVTGSSDYHGAGKVNRLGECRTSDEVLAEILRQGTGTAPIRPGAGARSA
ncbi:MAG TPA: PHP domain-containing protein [Candidatus Lumbricidophila sp.]|nr:PHP domain-containing protein [Candidatus Lumbricidophila sp.]